MGRSLFSFILSHGFELKAKGRNKKAELPLKSSAFIM